MDSIESEENKGGGAASGQYSHDWASSQHRPLSSNYYTYSNS